MKTPSLFRSLHWQQLFAQDQRIALQGTDSSAIIAVASLDDRLLTSPTAALLSIIINAEAGVPVAALDADGINQPLRGPLNAHTGGDLMGLTQHPHTSLSRVAIEEFVDTSGIVPLLTCWPEGSGSISPSELQEATRRLQRRWPTVILNLPYTVSPETIATGVNLATHVFLLADKHHTGHDWLYQPGHQLSELAQNQRVTVLTIQGKSKVDGRDVIHLPRTGQVMDARKPIDMPLDSESQTVFHRILRRIYKQNQP